MAGGYARVDNHDAEDPTTPVQGLGGEMHPIPNSPPPSFHSRSSSNERRRNRVDADLVDAFGDDEDDSDDEADDRQRLVRNTPPTEPSTPTQETQEAQARTGRNGYQSVPQPQPSQGSNGGRVFGGGSQADGVFSNMAAKPERGDDEKDEQPPSYEQAAADQAPPYWETTILAPGLGGPDDVFIDGLPVGSIFGFFWNALISWSFQIVGFLLTYLLHSTHAAKNGSRAGLGITLIQWGFSVRSGPGVQPPSGQMSGPDGYANPPDPNSHDFDPSDVTDNSNTSLAEITGSEWLSYAVMVVGWFILIRSISDYITARRHEKLVLQSPLRGLPIPIVAEGEAPERAV